MRWHQRLLHLLSDRQFRSGAELGKQLGIGCAAVHEHLAELKASGLPVDDVSGLGYRLARGVEPLDCDSVFRHMDRASRQMITKFLVEQSVDSTNNVLGRLHRNQSVHGAVCIAEAQAGGRGRRENPWVASAYRNLLMSMAWVFDTWPPDLSGISIAVAVTLIDVMKGLGIDGLGMKWPNDIVFEGKKLGGILIEISGERSGACTLIIGVGLNVNITERDAPAITQPWTDLVKVSGRNLDRNELAGVCISCLCKLLVEYPRTGFSPYQKRWPEIDVLAGQHVTIINHGAGELTHGKVLRVDNAGALILTEDGNGEKAFYSGDVSVRKR